MAKSKTIELVSETISLFDLIPRFKPSPKPDTWEIIKKQNKYLCFQLHASIYVRLDFITVRVT